MRYTLKDFQVTAADNLLAKMEIACFGAAKRQPQAVVLSSPTASGKTVIITEMIERILRGNAGQPADPRAVFLWLSDSPELNEQSKNKIKDASDLIPTDRLVTIEHPYSLDRLLPGRVYFLNTQKLTATSLLTKRGDRQERTIWEIIDNTVRAAPTSFFLIIDEAHRGMRDAVRGEAVRTRNENARLTTVQKFVKGDKSIGLLPVPLIVGISATPERFYAVLKNTDRTPHPVNVEPESVRGSGLIKDRIKLSTAEKGDEADWSMLADAAKKWGLYTREWEAYCKANDISPPVRPVLVIQVENGTDKVISKTDLATCIKVLRDACGHLPPEAYAHCFEHDADEKAGAIMLRKIDASNIQDDQNVRVIFFKTALTTGWDCPRAEVMMSFRKAVDDTFIAQLVGRMVRTPLARRIESNEFLNGVSLALPHYNEAAVAAIIKKLQDPESGAVGEAVHENEVAVYRRAEGKADLFDALATIPTYVVERPRKMAATARIRKLASMLNLHGIGQGQTARAIGFIVGELLVQRDRLRRRPEWSGEVQESGQVRVREYVIEYGEWRMDATPASYTIPATEENIWQLYERAGQILGHGLHDSYANRAEFRGDINKARLELHYIVNDPESLNNVQKACEAEFERLWKEHEDDILSLRPALRDEYKALRRRGGRAVVDSITVQEKIEVRRESKQWENHLYVDDKGKFGWDAGTWERAVLEAEMERRGFAGFLRNVPRRENSLCVPYGPEDDQAMYPDMLIFRRGRATVTIDILEPHGDQYKDHFPKAQGLARYAGKHGDGLGRIEMIRVARHKLQRLNMQDERIRSTVLKANPEQLDDLYEEFGS